MVSVKVFILSCLLILSQSASAGFLIGNGKFMPSPLAWTDK